MTEQFEDRPAESVFPDVVDDDNPERDDYPEPNAPAVTNTAGYVGTDSVGTTVEEEIEGESLDQKLARERPDMPVDAASEAAASEVPGDTGDLPGGGEPAGQIAEPNAGGLPDTEKDEIGQEFEATADSSPEEQAMHIVSET